MKKIPPYTDVPLFDRNGEAIDVTVYPSNRSLRFIGYDKAKLPKALPRLYSRREDCTGCGACFAVCPVGAVKMLPDEEGFYYPAVDLGLCVGCLKCDGACPIPAENKS
ncbi:MAG: 4Fe-4S dicluster domain-containing protein [Acutalibacteraceae bacterium]